MKAYDAIWWELDGMTYEIDGYWVSHPTSVWKDGDYFRSSFLVYYYDDWKDKIFDRMHKAIKKHGCEILKISKPRKARVSDYVVRVYIRKPIS